MARALELMWNSVTSFLSSLWNTISPALQSTVQPVLQRLDPLAWSIVAVGLLVLLLLLMLLRRRRPEEPAPSKPELLVSLGEIRVLDDHVEQDDEGRAGKGVMRPVSHALRMTVSNLNAYPVQLLEVALETPEMDEPVTLETAQIIGPEASVRVKETLPHLTGEAGKLTLYFYLSGSSKRYVSLHATFEAEPWDARYKVSPLGQTLTPFRQLASAQISRLRERSWQARQAQEAQREQREKVAAFDLYGDSYRGDYGDSYGRGAQTRAPERSNVSEAEDERPANGFNFPDEF